METVDAILFDWECAGRHDTLGEAANITVVNHLRVLNLQWIAPGKVCVDKVEDGNALMVYDGRAPNDPGNYVIFRLNEDKTKAILNIGNEKVKEYTTRGCNICNKTLPIYPYFDMPNYHSVRLCANIVGSDGILKVHKITTFNRVPNEKDALSKFTGYVDNLNSMRKAAGNTEIIYDTNEVKILIESKCAEIEDEYAAKQAVLKEIRQKEKEKEEDAHSRDRQPQVQEYTGSGEQTKNDTQICPRCNNQLDLSLGDKSGWVCNKCGYEQCKDRKESYNPYIYVKEDNSGNPVKTLQISNFNVVFNNIFAIDDVLRVDFGFNYIDSNDKKKKKILGIETDKITFHDQKEFTRFFSQYSNKLWYDKTYIHRLLTAINQDETGQNPELIPKTQHFGWNKDFTAYLTPDYDYELKSQDGVFELDHLKQFELVDQISRYCEKHVIDRDNQQEQEGAPKNLGSVRILNEKIASSIKLGFRQDTRIEDTLKHIKDTLLKLSPVVDRTIPIVFLAPLTSVLNKLDSSYQIYLQGKTGVGKSQISILFMNFFASINDVEQLVNVISDKPNAIEEIGHYHKDCLFVIDNFKESAIDKKDYPRLISLLQSIADRQGTKRMTKSDFGSFRVRGSTLVTGEEILQDASTIRKYDVVRITEQTAVDHDTLIKCHVQMFMYSGVMHHYIRWLMTTYGNEIEAEVERRKKTQIKLKNPLFVLNMVGYELFLDFMLHHHVINPDEYKTMYDAHFAIIKQEEEDKDKAVEEKTTAQKMIHAIRSGLSSRKFRLINDSEYDDNKNLQPIGQTSRDHTEVSYYADTYFLLKQIDSSLPNDIDSVWDQLKDDMHIRKEVTHRCDNKKSERLIRFKRDYIVPRTDMEEKFKWMDIAVILPGIIAARITERPDAKQYNEIINYLMQMYLPIEKKDEKKRFIEDVEPLLKLAFQMKFGNDWSKPLQ